MCVKSVFLCVYLGALVQYQVDTHCGVFPMGLACPDILHTKHLFLLVCVASVVSSLVAVIPEEIDTGEKKPNKSKDDLAKTISRLTTFLVTNHLQIFFYL